MTNYREYFHISELMIDEENWIEGFEKKNHERSWSVWRQDDNGNVFMVKNKLAKIDALRLVRKFEDKGHKQTYWAKEDM